MVFRVDQGRLGIQADRCAGAEVIVVGVLNTDTVSGRGRGILEESLRSAMPFSAEKVANCISLPEPALLLPDRILAGDWSSSRR